MAREEMARFGMVEVGAMVILLVVRVAGNFVVEENSLAVLSPESLKGAYQSAISKFGVPKYGGTLTGFVKYPAVNSKGCDNFPNDYFRATSGEVPYFALIDRGYCYFAHKAWKAQLAGAAAVLVADNRKEELITTDSPDEDPVPYHYLSNISIPCALITKDFGHNLKEALAKKELVTMRLEYELWTNSID